MAEDLIGDVEQDPNIGGELGSNDVVDVQFIGHSRGSVVISQALMDLSDTNPDSQYDIADVPSWLSSSYMMMTMLDPHTPPITRTGSSAPPRSAGVLPPAPRS